MFFRPPNRPLPLAVYGGVEIAPMCCPPMHTTFDLKIKQIAALEKKLKVAGREIALLKGS